MEKGVTGRRKERGRLTCTNFMKVRFRERGREEGKDMLREEWTGRRKKGNRVNLERKGRG